MVRLFTALKNQGASDPAAGVGDAFGEERDRQERAEKQRMDAEAQEFSMAATLETQRIEQEGLNLRKEQFKEEKLENILARGEREAENEADRDFTGGENEADRDFRGGESDKDRDFRGGENDEDRDLTKDENEADRDFKGGENREDRKFKRDENKKDQDFRGNQNKKDRQLNRDEGDANRKLRGDQLRNDAANKKAAAAALVQGVTNSNTAYILKITELNLQNGPTATDKDRLLGELNASLLAIQEAQANDADPRVITEMVRAHSGLRVRVERELADLADKAIDETNGAAMEGLTEGMLEIGIPQRVIDGVVTGKPDSISTEMHALLEVKKEFTSFEGLSNQVSALGDPESQNPHSITYRALEAARRTKTTAKRNGVQNIYAASYAIAADPLQSYAKRNAAMTTMLSLAGDINGGFAAIVDGQVEHARTVREDLEDSRANNEITHNLNLGVGTKGSFEIGGDLSSSLFDFVGSGLGLSDDPSDAQIRMKDVATMVNGARPEMLRPRQGGEPLPNASAQGGPDLPARWSNNIKREIAAGKFTLLEVQLLGAYMYEVTESAEWEEFNTQ
tara:strand:+ start:16399 stop:18099 length:1701 start_codon:yes stop_codon:yes gene_type:complete